MSLSKLEEFVEKSNYGAFDKFKDTIEDAKNKLDDFYNDKNNTIRYSSKKSFNKNKYNKEIEFRFKRPSYKIVSDGNDINYGSGDNLELYSFLRIFNYFENSEYEKNQNEYTVEIYNQKTSDRNIKLSHRKIIGKNSDLITYERKEKIMLFKNNYHTQGVTFPYSYFVNIGASLETLLDSIPEKGEVFIREIKRIKYKIPKVGYVDISTIIENGQKIYEVELELNDVYTINFSYEDSYNIFLKIISLRDNGFPLTFQKYKTCLLQLYYNLGDKEVKPASLTIPLVQPRDIERNDLKNNKLMGNLKYIVTQKVDGVRKILIHYDKYIFLAYPLREIVCIAEVEDYTSNIRVLDGEFIFENNKEEIFYFYPFDALTNLNGVSICNKNWYERRKFMIEICNRIQNNKTLIIYHKAFYQLPKINANCNLEQAGKVGSIFSKCISRFKINDNIEILQNNFDLYDYKNYASKNFKNIIKIRSPHKNDGIIFIPANDIYNRITPIEKNEKIGSLRFFNNKKNKKANVKEKDLLKMPKTLKWKPPNLLTLDFFHDKDKNGNLEFKVSTGYKDDDLTSFKNEIKEDFIIDTTDWKDSYFNKIGEWLYRDDKFHFIKLRPDKLRPNKAFSARNTWRLVKNPITWEDLCLKTDMLYRNAINNWKRRIIKSTKLKSKTLIDIGTGRGGDLTKFLNEDYKNMIFIEPDESNRDELINRIEKANFDDSVEIIVLSEKAQNTNNIYSYNNVKEMINRSNYINSLSMLSLTFFYKTSNDLYQLLKTMKPIGKNTKLTFFTVDGFSLLKTFSRKFEKDSNSEKEFLDTKLIFNKLKGYREYNLTKRSEGDLKVVINQNIKDNGIMGDQQVEYLVDISAIQQSLNSSYDIPNKKDNYYIGYRPYIDNILTINDIEQICIHKVFTITLNHDDIKIPESIFPKLRYTSNIFKPLDLNNINWYPLTRKEIMDEYDTLNFITDPVKEEKVIEKDTNNLYLLPLKDKNLINKEELTHLSLRYYCLNPLFDKNTCIQSLLNSILPLYQETTDLRVKEYIISKFKEEFEYFFHNLDEKVINIISDIDKDLSITYIQQICRKMSLKLYVIKTDKNEKIIIDYIDKESFSNKFIVFYVFDNIYSLVVKRNDDGFITVLDNDVHSIINF